MTKITKQDIEQMLYDLTGNDPQAKGSVDYTMFILNQYMLSEVLELIGDIEQRETTDMSLSSWTPEDYKAFGKNELKIELKQAFNELLRGSDAVR